MKLTKTAFTIAYQIISGNRLRITVRALLIGGFTTGLLLASQPVKAITVTPLGKGQLPSGDFIVMTQLTLDPGESVGWHYHPGTGVRVVLSGTLTEDEGCNNPLVDHTAGSAFQEDPGHVHRIFNLGSVPVVVLRTDILPPCYVTQGTIFVSGPNCEGNSGRSHLVPIDPCSTGANNSDLNASKNLVATASAPSTAKERTARVHPATRLIALARPLPTAPEVRK
jgi:quercetin dioxygenase-like cupin family protein